MQAEVVTIVKDAVPDAAQDFSFNLNNASTINQDFLLDDDTDPTLPNSQTFSVPPGTWSAAEVNLPAGWDFFSLVCDDPTANTTVNGTVATIDLVSDETVTCTFTNKPKDPTAVNLASFQATSNGALPVQEAVSLLPWAGALIAALGGAAFAFRRR